VKPTDDGGPAFPCVERATSDGEFVGSGMTLRDYFAAAALNGITSRPSCQYSHDEVARLAYRYADAILAARGGAS
jgi:hypothetical protein